MTTARVLSLVLCLAAIAAAALFSAAAPAGTVPTKISLVRLLAEPEAWDDSEVDVVGFVRFAGGEGAIWLHDIDEEFGIAGNGVRLDLSGPESLDGNRVRREDFVDGQGRFAFVSGTFDAGQRGPQDDFVGSLRHVRQLRPWASPRGGDLAGGTRLPEQMPLVRLFARPLDHDGHWVQVSGPARFEFEGTALYLHEEDLAARHSTNSIWLDLTPQQRDEHADHDGWWITVRGVFRASDRGHMGMFSGAISDIDWLNATPPRHDPK